MITQLVSMLFGGDRNAVRDVAEVFRVNAEAAAQRSHEGDAAALRQFTAEFAGRTNRTKWDSLIDGLNRLPRPLLSLAVFWVLVWTPVNPPMMAEVFTAWALIPDYAWALILLVVTFFFGGRQQIKGFDFQRDVAGLMARTQAVMTQRDGTRDGTRDDGRDPQSFSASDNPALDEWLATRPTGKDAS